MTDFYSILIQSLKKRDMWNAAQRETLYDQARMAMIKKLWALRPAISADEIQDRIGQFEAAVEKVEADVAIAEQFRRFGPEDDAARGDQGKARFDDAGACYAEEDELVIDGIAQHEQVRALPAPPRRATRPRHGDEDGEAAPRPALARAYADRGTAEDDDGGYEDEFDEPPFDDEHRYHDDEEDLPDLPPPAGRKDVRARRQSDRWNPRAAPPAGKSQHDLDRIRVYLQRSLNRLRGEPSVSGYGSEEVALEPHAQLKRYAKAGVAIVAILVIGWASVTVLLPALTAPGFITDRHETAADGQTTIPRSEPTPSVAAATTRTVEPRIAGAVGERISLFDGRNPTVFTAGSDNPIRFVQETGSGFAAIGSTASSSGVRAIVGPGIAQQLAGKSVRVVVEARSAGEKGASNIRVGYQAGSRTSPWKQAALGKAFTPIDFVWDVPANAGNANNFILLEPGIPGSGTRADIKSISLEVVAKN
jgi:hypothetical protein